MKCLPAVFVLGLLIAVPAAARSLEKTENGVAATATLVKVKNHVRVKRTPNGKVIEGKPGLKLPEGSIIYTLAKSRCEIKFGDGHFLRLASSAKIKIARTQRRRAKRTLIQLLRGRVRAMIDRALGDGDFGVYGSTTVTAVKGTDYEMSLNEDGEVTVAVNEGRVWVAELAGEDLEAVEKVFLGVILGNIGFGIKPGNMLHILPGSPFPTSPIPIPMGFPSPFTGGKKGAKKDVPGSSQKAPSVPGLPGPGGGFGFP